MKKYLSVLLLASIAALSGCEKRVSKNTSTLPDRDNLADYGQMLDPIYAESDAQLLTTAKPSNVSPNIAITKILQALNSYDDQSAFPYNTVFTVNRVNEVIVRGKKYYAGLCEFDFKKANGSDIDELNGISPCIGIVDAEDITKPAVIRTTDSLGKPYQITIHEESFYNGKLDSKQIFKFLDQSGYDNILSTKEEISNPNIEFDDNWRPYFSVMWLEDDANFEIGTAYYPKAFLLVDMQTEKIDAYSVDNPITRDIDEGKKINSKTNKTFNEIPAWVDWVYSKRLFIQMATHYGFPLENYGKRAYKNHLILDGTVVNDDIEVCEFSDCASNPNDVIETSKSKTGKDLIMTAFYTSRSNDLAVNYILQFNARTGKTVMYDRKGSEKGMTVKSAVFETLTNAALMKSHYDVEDLTLNPIFGRYTWHAVITRNLHDNEGNNTTTTGSSNSFYSEKDISYSIYAMTCLIEATNNLDISDIVCHKDENTLYTLYRDHLYKKDANNQRSTVLEDKSVSGYVRSKMLFDNYVILKLEDVKGTFIVQVDNVFDTAIGDALIAEKGDKVFLKYGDQPNLDKSPVRYIRIQE